MSIINALKYVACTGVIAQAELSEMLFKQINKVVRSETITAMNKCSADGRHVWRDLRDGKIDMVGWAEAQTKQAIPNGQVLSMAINDDINRVGKGLVRASCLLQDLSDELEGMGVEIQKIDMTKF